MHVHVYMHDVYTVYTWACMMYCTLYFTCIVDREYCLLPLKTVFQEYMYIYMYAHLYTCIIMQHLYVYYTYLYYTCKFV